MKTDAEEATCAEASAGEFQTLLWFSSLGGVSLVRPDFRLRRVAETRVLVQTGQKRVLNFGS